MMDVCVGSQQSFQKLANAFWSHNFQGNQSTCQNNQGRPFDVAGEYSCLSVDLIFKRQFSYYLITIYVPGCMLVIVSWVSFWLDAHAVPARVALGVTTLLTMSTQTASINSALPPVAYTKAIDVWQVRKPYLASLHLTYTLSKPSLKTVN